MAILTDEGGLPLHNLLGRYTRGEITDDVLLCKAKTVNSTTVDRISRPPIVLHHPCVAMLLLVQPDLLQKAFSNERLLVGGLLARCLAADSKMELQYEDEKNLPEVDSEIMATWNRHIRSLIKTFRFAEDLCWIVVGEGVKELSRKFHNEVIDQIRDSLSDISSFATRWVETRLGNRPELTRRSLWRRMLSGNSPDTRSECSYSRENFASLNFGD